MSDTLTVEELAKRNLEQRIREANEELRGVLDKYELGLSAEFMYTPNGVMAKPVFVNNKKPKEDKVETPATPEKEEKK